MKRGLECIFQPGRENVMMKEFCFLYLDNYVTLITSYTHTHMSTHLK